MKKIPVSSYINGRRTYSFESIADAAKAMRVDEKTIRRALADETKMVRSMTWKKREDINQFNRALCGLLGAVAVLGAIYSGTIYFNEPIFTVSIAGGIMGIGLLYVAIRGK